MDRFRSVTVYGLSMNYDEAVGQQLRIAKLKAGLTNAQITDRTGVSYETFKRYMKGTRTTPMDVLVRLSEAFGVMPSALLLRAEAELAAPMRVIDASPAVLPDDVRSALLEGPKHPNDSKADKANARTGRRITR